jgi:hypothetical protein
VLSPLDDSLWHQLPTTFDHVGTSDPRFFDRWWFAGYDPAGSAAVQVTMGVYSNMNVLDGGVMVLAGSRQHNLRVSRSLRPRFETVAGPLRVEPVIPMERHRLVVEPGDHEIALDLTWTALLAPEEERPHFSRRDGRVVEDYQRFDQVGRIDGVITTPDGEIRVDDWWACRDHSWGVRANVGIAEPSTGPQPATAAPAPAAASGAEPAAAVRFAFLFFTTSRWAGHVQFAASDRGRPYLTGLLRRWDDPATERHVVHASLAPELHDGTRRFASATWEIHLDDGERVRFETVSAPSTFAMAGLGYSGGWNDRRGLGVWRGIEVVEHETWDVGHPADVVLADGSVERPAHRIAPVAIHGERGETGTGSLTLIV